jgi:hypothetical protein
MNNSNINYLGFKDNGIVQIISNIHSWKYIEEVNENDDATQEISANIKKNEILVDYNKYMGGVDLLDQMTKYYAMDKKSRK